MFDISSTTACSRPQIVRTILDRYLVNKYYDIDIDTEIREVTRRVSVVTSCEFDEEEYEQFMFEAICVDSKWECNVEHIEFREPLGTHLRYKFTFVNGEITDHIGTDMWEKEIILELITTLVNPEFWEK